MIGTSAATLKLTVAVDDPAELVAVIVQLVVDKVPVGVPLITQVVALMLAHTGRVGELEQAVTLAPFAVSVEGVTDIAVPTNPLFPVELA